MVRRKKPARPKKRARRDLPTTRRTKSKRARITPRADDELDDFELEVMTEPKIVRSPIGGATLVPRNTPAPVVRGPQAAMPWSPPSSPSSPRAPWDTADYRRQKTINALEGSGAKSANAKARETTYVKSVVSIRLSGSVLRDLDELVQDACGANPPITRSSLIEEAVVSYLAEVRSQRRAS